MNQIYQHSISLHQKLCWKWNDKIEILFNERYNNRWFNKNFKFKKLLEIDKINKYECMIKIWRLYYHENYWEEKWSNVVKIWMFQ